MIIESASLGNLFGTTTIGSTTSSSVHAFNYITEPDPKDKKKEPLPHPDRVKKVGAGMAATTVTSTITTIASPVKPKLLSRAETTNYLDSLNDEQLAALEIMLDEKQADMNKELSIAENAISKVKKL